MQTKKHNLYFIYFCAFIVFILSSCSTTLEISVDKSASTKIEYTSSMGIALRSLMESLFQNFADSTTAQTSLFDGKQIEQALNSAGFNNTECKVSNNSSINCITTVSNLVRGLPLAPEMFEYKTNQANGKTSLSIKLSPENLQNAFQGLPIDFQNYAELLMAPVFTSEQLTPSEYKDLLASVYGNTVAEELTTSVFEIKVNSPLGTSKTFQISLSELLTLQNEQTYTFEW